MITQFPEVKVTFDGVINNENDFTLFIDQWRNYMRSAGIYFFI